MTPIQTEILRTVLRVLYIHWGPDFRNFKMGDGWLTPVNGLLVALPAEDMCAILDLLDGISYVRGDSLSDKKLWFTPAAMELIQGGSDA